MPDAFPGFRVGCCVPWAILGLGSGWECVGCSFRDGKNWESIFKRSGIQAECSAGVGGGSARPRSALMLYGCKPLG